MQISIDQSTLEYFSFFPLFLLIRSRYYCNSWKVPIAVYHQVEGQLQLTVNNVNTTTHLKIFFQLSRGESRFIKHCILNIMLLKLISHYFQMRIKQEPGLEDQDPEAGGPSSSTSSGNGCLLIDSEYAIFCDGRILTSIKSGV